MIDRSEIKNRRDLVDECFRLIQITTNYCGNKLIRIISQVSSNYFLGKKSKLSEDENLYNFK